MARLEPSAQVPTLRAEDFYLPPPDRPVDSWQLVPPAERVLVWYEQKQQRRLPRRSGTVLGVTVYPQINHGRWVADCPECSSAQIVTPTDPRMFCVECLSGWFQLTFPTDAAAAERSVNDLPVRERNWWHPDDAAWNRPREAESEPEPRKGEVSR
jgi:hypothetical protein